MNKGALCIRVGKNALYENKDKFIRSKIEKDKYFRKHAVEKTKGFELHHIVPLCWAKTALEFSALDIWKNLIYIDGYKHSIITQNNNQHTKIGFVGDDMIFTNFDDDSLYCTYNKNVLYDTANQEKMLSYNRELLHSCSVFN